MSEVRIKAPVKAISDPTMREKYFAAEFRPVGIAPGAFQIDREQQFWMCCPCGCGDVRPIPINTPGGWTLKGTPEEPTLAPSVFLKRHKDGVPLPHWHGFLRAGVWEQAG